MSKPPRVRVSRGYQIGLVALAISLSLSLVSFRAVPQAPGALFLAAMTIAAWYGGRGPGVLVTLVAAAAMGLFFIPVSGSAGLVQTLAAVATYAFVAFLIGWASDATRAAIRRAEAARDAAQLLEEQLRAALEAAEMRAYTCDLASGDVRFTGHLPSPHPALSFTTMSEGEERVHPEDREVVQQRTEAALRTGEIESQHRVVAPDGEVRWVLARGRVARDETGKPVRLSGVTLDVTERVRMETELRERGREVAQQNEELETQREELMLQNEELATQDRRRTEFLAMLAHELRNPLAPIVAAAEALRLRLPEEPSTGRLLGIIHRQSRHLSRLVSDLLDVSRITQGKIGIRKEPADLADVVEQALQTCDPIVQLRGHRLSVRLSTHPLPVEADATRLIQVVCNLLTNAARYTDPGGQIEVTLRPAQPAPGDPEPHPTGWAEIRVRDTGRGIPPALLSRVFEPFVQAEQGSDRSEGGLGVGLTLARTLVELHGGTIEALSEGPGRGSEFVVRLPLSRAVEAPAHLPRAAAECPEPDANRSAGHRILIVEDNPDAAGTLQELVELWGYAPLVALTGPEGLEQARAHRPSLILLDIGLPGMDGLEVARRIRAEPGLAHVPLIALSGYAQEEDRRRSHAAGIGHHLAKPVDPPHLRALISEELSRGEGPRDAESSG